jgi:hypothetical protein
MSDVLQPDFCTDAELINPIDQPTRHQSALGSQHQAVIKPRKPEYVGGTTLRTRCLEPVPENLGEG